MGGKPGEILDELLVLAARDGSASAFHELTIRWTPRLQRHAARTLRDADLAQDAVQEAWVSIARNLRRLGDSAKFPAWAYGITTRRCVDLVRRRMRDRRARQVGEDANLREGTAHNPEPHLESELDIAAAISRLPADQRLLVSLFYGEGLTAEEIASGHHLPVGTVKSRLHAARRTLMTFLQGAGDDSSR